MKTEIFKYYSDFLDRENKEVNGVSEEFAKDHPNYEADNETNKGCWNCSDCRFCRDCSDCRFCRDCRYCSDCSDCSDCRFCRFCSDCRYCENFKSNPERIVSPVLGSRKSQTTYYWNEETERIVCGCFKGTLSEFETRVKWVHGDNEHALGYIAWIEWVRKYRSL